MKAEVQEVINDIEKSLKLLSEKNNIIDSRTRLEEIESITNKADFWSNLNNAKLSPWQKAGADYAMYSPNTKFKKLYPSGEWNSTKIIFTEKKVEYWLNEQKILTFVPWSEDWYKRKNGGKWKNSKSYGKYKKGYIGLQDHNSSISFRNMKIRKL